MSKLTPLEIEHARLIRIGWRLDPDGCYRPFAAEPYRTVERVG